MIEIQLAGLCGQMDIQYEYMHMYCKEYLVSANNHDFYINIDLEDIESEQGEHDDVQYTKPYLETVAALRKVAEKFPIYDRVLCHGAVITYKDLGAYLFTAPSGTGKTTHIRQWRKYLKDNVDIINGDKPFLAIHDDHIQAYGSPWAGKEGWQKNRDARLQGICFIEQGTVNSIRRLDPVDCIGRMFGQIYMPRDKEALAKTLELMEKILTLVPVYLLTCDISEEAVKCSFEALTGLDYEKEKNGYED